MTAPGLAMDDPERVGDRFETLDSPISWIGLHFSKDLRSLRHNRHDTAGDTMLQAAKSVV